MEAAKCEPTPPPAELPIPQQYSFKTRSTRCSDVTVTARESNGSADSEVPTKPSLNSCAGGQ